MPNKALILFKPSIWIRPWAVAELMEGLERIHGVRVITSGKLDADIMDLKIDRHYKKHSKNALHFEKDSVGKEARELFQQKFGLDWDKCIVEGSGPDYSIVLWRELEKRNDCIKLEDGLYVAKVSENRFVVNGFYASMRKQYLRPSPYFTKYYVVEFDYDYSLFKEEVIGATDPSKAHEKSLRGHLYRCWTNWLMERQPSLGENCVHGSACAEEAAEEIENFLGSSVVKQ